MTRERGRNDLRVTGTIPSDARDAREFRVTMEEPELHAGLLFRNLLEARGIRVSGPVERRSLSGEAAPLAAHVSPPLAAIAPLLNKPSDNLVAEMLVKELGYHCRGSGTWAAGTAVVRDWLQEAGIETGGVRVSDGSGLSRMDLVTARAVSDLLRKADSLPWREVFLASLPVAGVDGTLRNRMKETAAAGNVRAKTGTLSRVTALGGYVTARSGQRLAFSILISNYPGPTTGPGGSKRVEDAIAIALAESGPPGIE